MISVCLCTYNGELYLRSLLNSLITQTVLPDEIIVCDDCSTDSTKSILEEYARNNSNIEWKLLFNKTNVGWRVNFHNAIEMSHGEIILLCDQDDIWKPEKIEIIKDFLCTHDDAMLVACSYEVLYETNDARETKAPPADLSIEIVNKSSCFMNPIRPGCTFGFKSSLKDYYLNTWDPSFAHDAMLWRIAFLKGGLYLYNYNGIVFRRHSSNASSFYGAKVSLKKYTERYAGLKMSLKCLSKLRNIAREEGKLSFLENITAWYQQRLLAYSRKSFFGAFSLPTNYKRYDSYKSYLIDFILVLRFGGTKI